MGKTNLRQNKRLKNKIEELSIQFSGNDTQYLNYNNMSARDSNLSRVGVGSFSPRKRFHSRFD